MLDVCETPRCRGLSWSEVTATGKWVKKMIFASLIHCNPSHTSSIFHLKYTHTSSTLIHLYYILNTSTYYPHTHGPYHIHTPSTPPHPLRGIPHRSAATSHRTPYRPHSRHHTYPHTIYTTHSTCTHLPTHPQPTPHSHHSLTLPTHPLPTPHPQ